MTNLYRNQEQKIDICMKGLQISVNTIVKYYEKRHSKKNSNNSFSISSNSKDELKRIQNHMTHLLKNQVRKRTSLCSGLECLRKFLLPQVISHLEQTPRNESDIMKTLQHFFGQFLRLHDGLVLLESGECRHVGDISAAEKTPYPSRLSSAKRQDGYTCLYNPKLTYSGTGMDEFNDEEMGLKNTLIDRLLPYLRVSDKVDPWGALLTRGADVLDILLDRMEIELRDITNSFSDLKEIVEKYFLASIRRNGSKSSTISLAFVDKFEYLKCRLTDHEYHFERRASEFNLLDKSGVLPNHSTTSYLWEKIMRIPFSHTSTNDNNRHKLLSGLNSTKNWRILEESDSSDRNSDNDKNKTRSIPVPLNDGENVTKDICRLRVRIERKRELPGIKNVISIRDIKGQMGVDDDKLAAAREGLEAEEYTTREDLNATNNMAYSKPGVVSHVKPDTVIIEKREEEEISQSTKTHCNKSENIFRLKHTPIGRQLYFKWGDELLPQKLEKNRGNVPIYKYPHLPPPIPINLENFYKVE